MNTQKICFSTKRPESHSVKEKKVERIGVEPMTS